MLLILSRVALIPFEANGFREVDHVVYYCNIQRVGKSSRLRQYLTGVFRLGGLGRGYKAERYRLFDLDRLEKMVLRQIADDYFPQDLEAADE
jgi:hypothetical protein